MEVKEGYRQTEVGVIPNDWHIDTLGKISFVTKLAGFEYSLHFNSYKDEGEIIVVRGTNITHNRLDLTDVKTIPSKTSKNLLRSKLFKNDLVFAYVGTIGPVYLIEENDRFHLGPNTAKITVNKQINSKYLNHYFKSSILKKEIIELTSIGAQPSLSMTKIRSFKIIIPPTIEEQTAIANALSDIDELISQTEKLKDKKKAIKQGVMQELLKPKEGWVTKKLGDVGKCLRGVSYNPELDLEKHESNITYSLLRSNNIQQGLLDFRNVQFVNQNKVKGHQVVQESDIIICMANGSKQLVGKAAISRNISNNTFTFGAFMGCFRVNPSINPSFIFALFESKKYRDYIDFLLSGSTINNLNPSSIELMEFAFPSDNEQNRIAKIYSELQENVLNLERKLQKLKLQKQGMMQALLTGKIRLL